ncbi:MAG: hypothetical protein Q8K55_14220 [Gemmatimonadaceae bacterium]|nr:hypothetical protein [Gemmatimonadaceae bacterium]
MNPNLRDRIARRLDSLSDDRGYQLLDYVEFLESKYAERQTPPPNVFQRFAEGVEDTMRAGRVSTQAIGQTMDLMNKAMGVLSGVTAAGKSVADDLMTTASQITTNPLQSPPPAPAAPPAAPAVSAAPPPAAPPAAPPAPPPATSPAAPAAIPAAEKAPKP